MEWFATSDATQRVAPTHYGPNALADALRVEEVDGHRFAVATRGAQLMRARMVQQATWPDDGRELGHSRQYNIGEDRGVEIGWRRSAAFMGPEYMRRPAGYIRTVTISRHVEKATRPLTPDQMRRMGRELAAWADKLERYQSAWDADQTASASA